MAKKSSLLPLPPYHTIPLKEITVGERFRTDLGDIDGLAASIGNPAIGLLQPLVIDRNKRLLAGGRRYAAVTALGWEAIDCHFIDEVDDLTAREIELEENIRRKNLEWQEQARLTEEIDKINRIRFGDATAGNKLNAGVPDVPEQRGWGMRDTAAVRHVSVPIVSQDLALARALEVMPSLAKESSRANALRKLRRLEEDLERELILRQRAKEVAQIKSFVRLGDATSLILELDSNSVDIIITDPPYGDDNLPYGQLHRTDKDFDDSPEAALALLRSVGPELRRVLKPTGHLYAFFGPRLWEQSLTLWKAAGFDVRDVVCIWYKPGGATGTVNWDHEYAPVWEPFLFASNKERRLDHKRDNVFAFAPPTSSERFHPNQKSVGLIEEMLRMSSDPNDLVFDPFAGSGTTGVAAINLDRRFLLFEQNPRMIEVANERITAAMKAKPIIVPIHDEDEVSDGEEETV
jgi:DNA modification methylase